MKPIISLISKKIFTLCSKIFSFVKQRRSRIKLYSYIFLITFGIFLSIYLIVRLIDMQRYNIFFEHLVEFFLIIVSCAIVGFIVDVLSIAIEKYEKNYYKNKTSKTMGSYSGWVKNSTFGRPYDLLEYLNESTLTDLIKEIDASYMEEENILENKKDYALQLKSKKKFDIYNKVIIELSNKSLFELKNMLSFIEMKPKKNWMFTIIKTSFKASTVILIPTIINFIGEILQLMNNGAIQNIGLYLSKTFNIERLITGSNSTVLPVFIIVYGPFITFIILLFYKIKNFDEPHTREYLKKTIERAIEINQEKIPS